MTERGGGRCLHEIFEARAREAPARVAVSAGGEQITYGALDARAERLAARLRARGAGPEARVGLYAHRGIDLVVGVLGILKAGGAYVPIDPLYPEARVRFLLHDAGLSLVATVARLEDEVRGLGATPVCIDRDGGAQAAPAPSAPRPTDASLAYVIYTSGSTGTPKGVMVEHRCVTRLFARTQPWFGFGPDDVWSWFHAPSFDFSVWEIWGALLYGGRLVVVPAETARAPGRFRALLEAEQVTVLNQTPSAFHALQGAECARPAPSGFALRVVVFGGERLDPAVLAPWVARFGQAGPALVNMYGITETTVHATFRRIAVDDLGRAASPIGVPVPDLQAALLDEEGAPVPDGTPGELFVAGPGVARGYLGRPALTAERFVPAAGGGRRYRSGDRAVRLAGGELAYLGRVDEQLKVRGFRIEPQEVECCLAADPAVAAAVVTPWDHGGGDVRLVAHVVPAGDPRPAPAAREALAAALRARARAELPAHMRPSAYRVVPALPRTPHGKVDRQALRRAGEAGAPAPLRPARAGLGRTEQRVGEIIRAVMERGEIGRDDDLFDLGATSLAFVRIVTAVNEDFGVALTGAELGDTASVRRLAECVDEALPRSAAVPLTAAA